jgi:hypothetical protein
MLALERHKGKVDLGRLVIRPSHNEVEIMTWPRSLACGLLMVLTGINAAARAGDLPPSSPNEPKAKTLSIEKAAGYLDEVAIGWTRERKCGTCHTNYAYMLARPSVRETGPADAMKEVRAFFEQRVEHWNDANEEAAPR